MGEVGTKDLADVIPIDDERIEEPAGVPGGSVEETLNAQLEADRTCDAECQEGGEAGRTRGLGPTRGNRGRAPAKVSLKVPPLRRRTVETASIALSPARGLGQDDTDGDPPWRASRCGEWRTPPRRGPVGHWSEPGPVSSLK